jgi:hypothetical protein
MEKVFVVKGNGTLSKLSAILPLPGTTNLISFETVEDAMTAIKELWIPATIDRMVKDSLGKMRYVDFLPVYGVNSDTAAIEYHPNLDLKTLDVKRITTDCVKYWFDIEEIYLPQAVANKLKVLG